ncbi:uncharacterized protein N7482_000895 [Penicillium canariense]|uniref:GPI transamidase component PIG-S n=1 Tax=Penicillium canariense TaxID=189055 RepID=A0A9W9IE52_9EURO|nr:uncharacterized protein N7482_000895 [Penicillium canariense]KAJ5175018.1 hypothetical protein N7482_000895 [Penicillium canariense]
MAISEIVSDESLLPVLGTTAETLAQCQQLIALLNPENSPTDPTGLQELSLAASKQQKILFARLAQLRGQNRDAIFRVRDTKHATAEARQEIDRLHLQLQNLYYEQKHLTGEIAACESYDHKYLSLPLIPVEEFLELFPEHRESNEHDLMVARINHEHAEREKLEQARQELLKRKQALIAENKKRKDDLANLDKDLEKFIDLVLPEAAVPPVPPSPPSAFPTLLQHAKAPAFRVNIALAVRLQGTKHAPTMTSQTGDHESLQTVTSTADLKSITQRVPPPETPEAIQTRFRVIAAFWAVIIFLGFPIWWKTTSIYRAHLPIQDMVDWADGKACRPVFPLEIHVVAPAMQSPESQHLVRTTQHALDDLNEFAAHHLRLKLTNDTDTSVTQNIDNNPALRADTTQLDIFYPPSQAPIPSSSNPPLSIFIAEELQRLYSEEKATIAYILSGEAAGHDLESISRRLRRSMKYADTYHLSFSLFTPGSAPSSWDIEAAVQEYLSPLLHAFGPISNFTIDTQVQLYATFSPMAPPPVYDQTEAAWTLKKEDLSAFINAAEWPLNPSIGNGPTLNFILYVPDPSQSPMVVKENRASSWIIPQWGGVFLLNPPLAQADKSGSQANPTHISQEVLRPAFLTFSHQLLTLLGTPTTPASLPLRLQTLIRVRAATLLLSASSTMGSLARLTESLPSIPIPATVASSVSTTLTHLSSACSHLREGRFSAALASARIAETEAERSFFEKSMVGQVYFPDEHKVAVYLPLLGPIGVPLLVGLMKELKRLVAGWKARKRATA